MRKSIRNMLIIYTILKSIRKKNIPNVYAFCLVEYCIVVSLATC